MVSSENQENQAWFNCDKNGCNICKEEDCIYNLGACRDCEDFGTEVCDDGGYVEAPELPKLPDVKKIYVGVDMLEAQFADDWNTIGPDKEGIKRMLKRQVVVGEKGRL